MMPVLVAAALGIGLTFAAGFSLGRYAPAPIGSLIFKVEILCARFNIVRNAIERMEGRMSNLSDQIASVNQSLSDLEAAQAASSQAVTDAIARLEAIIAAGAATPADLAALQDIKSRLDTAKGSEDAQKAQADAEAPPAQ